MTRKGEIINEKLQSIDHKLDVNHLWTELEAKLPPEKRRRRPLLWLWSLMALGVVVVASIMALQTAAEGESKQTAPVSPVMSSQLTPEPSTQYATVHQDKSVETAVEPSSRVEMNDFNTNTSEDIRRGNTDRKRSIQEHTTSIIKEQINRNKAAVTDRIAAELPKDYSMSSPGMIADAESMSDANVRSTTTTISQPSTSGATKIRVPEPQKLSAPVVEEQLQFPFLPMIDQQDVETSSDTETESMPAMAMVEPIRPQRSPLTVSMVGTYGFDLAGAKTDVDVMSLSDGQSAYEHVDVAGLELMAGYDLYKNWGLAAGVRYQKYTDRQSSFRRGGIISTADADGGFAISNEDFLVHAYSETDAVDLSLGVYHRIPLGSGISLRPEIGAVYNTTLQAENTSILENVSRDNFVVSSDTYATTNLGYYAKLGVEAQLSPAVSVLTGVTYGARSVTQETAVTEGQPQQQRVLSGQLGLQYRF